MATPPPNELKHLSLYQLLTLARDTLATAESSHRRARPEYWTTRALAIAMIAFTESIQETNRHLARIAARM